MPEAGTDFQRFAESTRLDELNDSLGTGEEGEFRTAADETTRNRRGITDTTSGGEIDAKRFLGEKIFSCFEHV